MLKGLIFPIFLGMYTLLRGFALYLLSARLRAAFILTAADVHKIPSMPEVLPPLIFRDSFYCKEFGMIWVCQKAYKFPHFKPIAIFGCSCKSRLKVVNSFVNSCPVNKFPLVAELTVCRTRTVRCLWISYIHNNHFLLLDAPVISQYVFTSRHKVLILCITHRLLLSITSSAVCVIA